VNPSGDDTMRYPEILGCMRVDERLSLSLSPSPALVFVRSMLRRVSPYQPRVSSPHG
jgi:hypothetical protein